MNEALDDPAGIVKAIVAVHGPLDVSAKRPVEELDESVTVVSAVAFCTIPTCCSCTVIGAVEPAALMLVGAVVKASAGGNHVANVFHVSVNAAPANAAVHVAAHAASGEAPES